MAQGGNILRGIQACMLAAATALPVTAFAEEPPSLSEHADEYYSSLEDLALRRTISDLSSNYPSGEAESEDTSVVGIPYFELEGGSAGGYVNLGGPATSTFMASPASSGDRGLLSSVEFGLDWRPDIKGGDENNLRTMGKSLAGTRLDSIGVRADVTALLQRADREEGNGTAWRVSGMLGSTSLSLMKQPDGPAVEVGDANRHLLWDVGVGWTSGSMSLNAGYQSTFSLNDIGDDLASVGVLSVGADYSVAPGLSVFGEFNMIDSPLESTEVGFGTVIIVGTGVSF